MSKNKQVLKIYCLSSPQLTTEWLSLLGDKYLHALSFDLQFTSNPALSDVVVWDGLVGRKFESTYLEIVRILKGKMILLMGDSSTLYKDSNFVRYVEFEPDSIVELWGWSVLPEDILSALEVCFKKKFNV